MAYQELLYGNTRIYLFKGKAKYLLFDTDWAGTLPAFFKGIKTLGVTVSDIPISLLATIILTTWGLLRIWSIWELS
ncbi:hypothetical protein ACVRYP_05565 [Streptococcus rifensis]